MNNSLGRLAQLLTPPAPAPGHKDWKAVFAKLGTALPGDYTGWIDRYGGGQFDGYLWLLEPHCANQHYDLIHADEDQAEAFEMLWDDEEVDADRPAQLSEPGSRLVPWAYTDNGECLFWLARQGQTPDEWTVMVTEEGREEWEHFPMGCLEFLVAALEGSVKSELLWDQFPAEPHEFTPARGRG